MKKLILSAVSITLFIAFNSVFAQNMYREGKIIFVKTETSNFYVQMYDPNNGWALLGQDVNITGKALYATALAAKINNSTVRIDYSYPNAGSPFCIITAITVLE